ncbi:MAG: hypothetical protein QG596_704 [Actinomycetota bacterium]|nr:hypothetical protein [Actinomycetota bacterium]
MAEFRSQPVGRQAFRAGALFAAILGLLTCVALAGVPQQAEGESNRRVLLGATKNRVTPNCGSQAASRACIAEGKITGYQVFQRGATGKNFVVPFNRGKVVAWSIQLSNPTARDNNRLGPAQRPYFNRLFGTPSKARISILRQVQKNKKGPPRYKLIRASGTQVLNPYFGTEIKFAIRPLNVAKGDVVALTIPTWAPAFWVPLACNASPNGGLVDARRCASAQKFNTWRGSRAPGLCSIGTDDFDRPNEALRKSRPQQKINSIKRYGCYYDGGRLLYKATVVAR